MALNIKLERIEPSQIIKPIKAAPHTPPYKIHKYFARRPWNVFEQMIQAVSVEGEIILDPFCGGGVTVYEGVKTGRNVIGIDINPLATFIVKNMLKVSENKPELELAIDKCRNYLNQLYDGFNSFQVVNDILILDWSELTYEVKCNHCGNRNLLLNANKISNGLYKCDNPGCSSNTSEERTGFHTKNAKRFGYRYIYLINKKGKTKTIKEYDSFDLVQQSKHLSFLRWEVRKHEIPEAKTKIPLLWDRQFEDQLAHKGITHFEDFFTERNFLLNTLLRWKIDSLKEDLSDLNYELLRLIHSNVLKETNIMSFTNDTWQGGNPTTWSKHAFWLPSQFCEVNLLTAYENSVDRIMKCLEFNEKTLPKNLSISAAYDSSGSSNATIITGTISNSNIPNESVDAIVTDPPYGSNVQYLELSHFWYNWNKDLYSGVVSFSDEAVANRKKFSGSKSMQDYERLLYSVYKDAFRVLKNDRHMTLTFNNKNITAWLGLLISIFKSGFTFDRNGIIFQDGVANYKQTAHTKFDGSPFGDFIYIFKKGSNRKVKHFFNTEKDFIKKIDNIFQEHISNNGIHDKNHLKRSMFLEAMPYIEDYVKVNLKDNFEHNLYSYFTKTYFKKLYH